MFPRNERGRLVFFREVISRGIAAGATFTAIACSLGRPTSTVSREVNRHGGRLKYRATEADKQAWVNAQRPKKCALAKDEHLRDLVAQKLALDWSPAQITGWLATSPETFDAGRVSHETIYKSLFMQARGVLKQELVQHLRTRRTMRRSKLATTDGQPRGQIKDAVSIHDRPAEIEDRAIPGHWEGDCATRCRTG